MTSSKHKGFILKLDESLFQQVNELIRLKSYKEKEDLTKQKLITDAIKAKLAFDKESTLPPAKKKRCVNYKIDKELSAQLEEHISKLKKIDSSYSLKRWIEEAIFCYLEKESCP